MTAHRKSDTYQRADARGKNRLDKIASLSPLERCLYFVEERENIRLKKEANEPKPWTIDPILANFRFCNCRRMDDAVSRYLYDNWYKPNFDHPNMLLAVVIARHFNLPSCLEHIGFPTKWKPNEFVRKLTEFKAQGNNLFNGAYMIRSSSNASPRFYPAKHEMVIRETVQQFVDNPPDLDTSSMESCVETIMTYRNFGSFMAGQVVCDLRHAISGTWEDKDTWAPIGPGSRRGFNRLFERDLDYKLKQGQFLKELRQVKRAIDKALPKSMTSRWEMMDIQNIAGCEHDKYLRALFGEGRPKQKYQGAK